MSIFLFLYSHHYSFISSMISILIPIYNFNATDLVQKIVNQCIKAKITYEVICFDDGSLEKFKEQNRPLLNLMGVNYVELSENYGRSRIRNKLAKVASFPFMLFLDCDSKIKYASFIKNYVKEIKAGNDVVYGGRVYKKGKPRSKAKLLHWKFGTEREALPLTKRAKKPYLSFQTNNFLIHQDVFTENRFDESIDGYGYEDLVFAEILKQKGIPITHIHNPVEHIDLIPKDRFLEKTKTATENLKILLANGQILETRLTKLASKIRSFGLSNLTLKYLRKKKPAILDNLRSDNPQLRKLDMYKLLLFLED